MRLWMMVLLGLAGLAGAAEGLPDGAKGFSGQVQGAVVGKGEGSITYRIAKVMNTSKNNKATNGEALNGQTVRVLPGGGKETSTVNAAFLRTLHEGQDVTLELKNDGDVFVILELSKEQRDAAGVPPAKNEKTDKAERKREKKAAGGDKK
jgi:hypothetical protein